MSFNGLATPEQIAAFLRIVWARQQREEKGLDQATKLIDIQSIREEGHTARCGFVSGTTSCRGT